MEFPYFQGNVINIFTDASTTTNFNARVMAVCSGFIAVQNNHVIASDYKIFNGATSQFAELYAMMMALTFMNYDVWSKRYSGRCEEVNNSIYNLFSDSLYAIEAMKGNVLKWVTRTNTAINNYTHPTYNYDPNVPPDLLKPKHNTKKKKNSSGSDKLVVVPNQEVILHCMGLIIYTQKKINLYHIKGHMNEHSDNGLEYARNMFKSKNNVVPNDNIIKNLIHWNNIIDNSTREHLMKVMSYDDKIPTTVQWPVKFYPTLEQQCMYKNYVR